MKSNYQSITSFAQEIERRETVKKDFIVPSGMMVMKDQDTIELSNVNQFKANQIFHSQLASKLDIPKRYYDKIASVPGLREANVNMLLHSDEITAKNHLVRTLDGTARAFLSDRYRPIDHYFFLNTLIPILMERSDVHIFSNSITDSRMYLQVVFKQMEMEVSPGDVVRWGIALSNSEVGQSAIAIEAFIERLKCINGMVAHSLIRKTHLGRQLTEDDMTSGLFLQDTIDAEMKALGLKFRDIVNDHLQVANFQRYINTMREARGEKIENLPGVIQEVTRRFGFSQSDSEILLTNIAREGEVNKYGLMNAITFLAHEVQDLDRQYELEKLGARVLDMPKKEWAQLNDIAA